jgi:hypothetical protein
MSINIKIKLSMNGVPGQAIAPPLKPGKGIYKSGSTK